MRQFPDEFNHQSLYFISTVLKIYKAYLLKCRGARPPALTKKNFRKLVDKLYLAGNPDVARECKKVL